MPNSEYPDLPFIPPRAFGRGRPAPPRVIVIHYTAGSERSTSAEDGAAYDQRRTDGTSTHYFADSNSVVQCVYTWDRANAALYNGNRIGIQYELCGTQQTRAQWLDADSDATLTNAARQAARDATRYGIPVRHLTPAQVRAGGSGFCGHDTITLAYPEDHGDHMDPGAAFPWDVLLARVQQFIGGATPQPLEDDMPLFDSFQVKTGPGHDAAGNLIPANVTEVGLPMSGSLWRDKNLYLSFKADFGKAKLRYAVSYDNGSGQTEWKIGTLDVDSTKPRGGPSGAVIPVPPAADGVSLFRVPIDADDSCEAPVALIVEIG